MGAAIKAIAIATLHVSKLASIGNAGQVGGELGAALVLFVDIFQVCAQLLLRVPHTFCIAEEILSTQEEAATSALLPDEAEVLSERAERNEGLIGAHALTANGDGICGTGQRFQHR